MKEIGKHTIVTDVELEREGFFLDLAAAKGRELHMTGL